MGKLDTVLKNAASSAWRAMEERDYSPERRYSERLVSHLFVHELLLQRPELASSVWMEYRPWPDEGDERIDLWINHASTEGSIAVELKVGDPTPEA